jgi:hypothetical protein
MADQTVEIKLVLRDELSRQLQPLIAQVRQLSSAIDTTRPQQHMERLGVATAGVRRELSALSQITFGGLIGGGIVAGLMATAKALGDMANRGLQLRYSADALGVTTGMLNKFSDAMMGLGRSRESGASSIEAATKSLRELQIEGGQSKLFTELEHAGGESGKRLAQELAKEISGPRGLQGGLEYAMRRMAGMRQESAAKFAEALGLGPGFGREAARDYLEILGQLPKRLELSHRQQLDLAKANASLGISWDNIKTQLSGALLPMFAQLASTLDKFLQSAAGQEFTKQLEAWGREMNLALKDWLEGGGLQRLINEMGSAVHVLKEGFQAADGVITAMGTNWGTVLGGLALAKFAGDLASIARNLRLIGLIPGLGTILAILTLAANKKEVEEALAKSQEETIKQHPDIPGQKGNLIEKWWDYFKSLPGSPIDLSGGGAQKQSYQEEGQPKTDSERRADAAEKKQASQKLTEEFKALQYDLAKLNDFIMPGGPEGGKGPSGFQLPNYQQEDFTFYYPGASGPKGMEGPYETARAGPGGGGFTPKTLDDFRMGLSSYVTVASAASKLGQTVNLGDVQYRSPLDGKVYQLRNVPGYTHDRGGAFTEDKPDKRDIAVGDFSGTNPDTGQPFTDASAHQFSVGSHQQFPPGTFPVEGGAPLGQGGIGSDRSPIIDHLASRDSASVNGSATVDIDISGINAPARNPYDLFKWQPLGGAVQMQNVTRPDNNPLSFQ